MLSVELTLRNELLHKLYSVVVINDVTVILILHKILLVATKPL